MSGSGSKETDLSRSVAIIGAACRFPRADDPEEFWSNIVAGRTAFSDIPRDRWDHRAFFHASQREVDKTWTARGSFIDGYRKFAALHYGIAPRRLEVMDPQQRLLIETTRGAIQDAGYETRSFDRSRTGVFVGVSISEFKNLAMARVAAMEIVSGQFGPSAGSQAERPLGARAEDFLVHPRAQSDLLSGRKTYQVGTRGTLSSEMRRPIIVERRELERHL